MQVRVTGNTAVNVELSDCYQDVKGQNHGRRVSGGLCTVTHLFLRHRKLYPQSGATLEGLNKETSVNVSNQVHI